MITIIVISPYLVRNIIQLNTFTITKSVGWNLWKGNNPKAGVEGNSDYEAAVDAHNKLNDSYDTSTPAGGAKSKGKGAGNTLIALKDDLLLSESDLGAGGFLGLGNLLGIKGQKIDRLSDDVLGGPKSLYGLGGTTIRRYTNQTIHEDGKGIEYENTEGKFAGPQIAKYLVSSYGITADNAKKMADGGTSHNDFRKDLEAKTSEFMGYGDGKAADYEKNNPDMINSLLKNMGPKTDHLEDTKYSLDSKIIIKDLNLKL